MILTFADFFAEKSLRTRNIVLARLESLLIIGVYMQISGHAIILLALGDHTTLPMTFYHGNITTY